MPDGSPEIELEQAWIGAEDLPVHFANAFIGVVGPNAVFLNIGSQFPPAITSEEDLNDLKSLGYIPVKPIARLALSPEGLDELIQTLETTRSNYQELKKALGGQQP